jgi:uncharacterized protein (DUF433 family)
MIVRQLSEISPYTDIVVIPILAEAPRIQAVGGALRVGGTSVTLETVLWTYQQGSTPEDIVDQYPTLNLGDVYDVIAYYLRHRQEIDQYLATREQSYRKAVEDLARETPPGRLQTRVRDRRR